MMPALTRQAFLKRISIVPAICLSLGTGLAAAPAQAAEAKKRPARPPRTCGGYRDVAGNGVCDRSENGGKCTARRCPGNALNSAWKTVAEQGAPAGVCALWNDPRTKGYCSVSSRTENPCTFTKCPAHKNTTTTLTP